MSTRGQRVAVLAAVLALHALLILLWRPPHVTRWPAPRSVPITIRFLPAPAAPSPSRGVVARPPSAPPRGSPRGARPMATIAPAIAKPSVATSSPGAPTVAPSTDGPRSATEAAPSFTAGTPPPLNLDLPRAWHRPASAPDMTEAARRDPRANDKVRPTLERAMAATLSTARSTETLADGTQRIRVGNTCTLVHPSRASGLDPFDHAHNQTGGSEPCP